MPYTMWKRCRKIIDEARSLAKGDMYFGGQLPTEMTICVKSNETGYQHIYQLKIKQNQGRKTLFSQLSVLQP